VRRAAQLGLRRPALAQVDAKAAIDATARNSDCQFCSARFQKSAEVV
jgi:hypothetical protein